MIEMKMKNQSLKRDARTHANLARDVVSNGARRMWRACSTHGDVARETLERARVLGGGAVRRMSGLTTNVWLRTTTTTTRTDDGHGDNGDDDEEAWTTGETRATTVIASRMCDGDDGATDGASETRTYESNALGLSDARACAFVDEDCLVVVSSDGSACAVIEDVYGEGKVRAVESASLIEVKGAKSRVTRAESCEAGGGKASVAVGDSNGNLYCVSVDRGAGKFTWSVFDRSNRSDWVDDMHDDDEDEEEDAEASVLSSPTKTPGKTRRWGALRSATMAAGALLSRKVNAGGIRSLRFAQGSSESKKRLLACEASGTIEEWSLDMSGAKEPTLAHTHKVSKMIKRSLRVSSNVTLISADWIVTETGVDISVLAECDGKGSLHRLRRTHGTDAMEIVASTVPPAGSLPAMIEQARVRVDGDDTFILANDGSAVMFAGVDYSRVLTHIDTSNHEPLIDATCASTGEWYVLTKDSGVSVFSPHASGRQTTPRRGTNVTPTRRTTRSTVHVDSPMTDQPINESDAMECVRSEFEDYFAGRSGPPGQTKSRLRASGAFLSESAPFATMSKGVVDALPKKLSGKSTRGGPTIEENGTEKINRHLIFLEFLSDSGVWNEINAAERSEILTHGEMIAASLQVRALQNTVDEEMKAILEEIATSAGASIKSTDDALEERADVEICFSRSSEAKQLFSAVEEILGAKLKKEKVLEKRAIILDTCARGLLVALEAANDFRRRRTGMYPPSMGTGVNWTCELEARGALRALAYASCALHSEAVASNTHVGLAPILGSRLLATAAPLLDACAAHLGAALPSSTERLDAHNEYVADRRKVLPALLECAEHSATVPFDKRPQRGSLSEGTDVNIESVAAISEAHYGYEELFAICDTANGTERLHHYMRTLLGAPEDDEQSFSHFVYNKLAIEQKRDATLLRDLPPEFHKDLEEFLAPYPNLRWLMELRVGKYAEAMKTLVEVGGHEKGDEKIRLLSMAKLAALAAGCDEERVNSFDQMLT